jgi:hypothetical protein
MGLLYGRAGRLTVQNGGFWPGQDEFLRKLEAGLLAQESELKVRKTPSWPRNWANSSLL